MSELLPLPASLPLDAIHWPVFDRAGISVTVLRLDAVDPVISGNKWFKLRHNLHQARAAGATSLISFGGAWSNHLHALAHAASLCDLPVRAYVRGELPEPLNPCLADCRAAGMALVPLDRASYRRRYDPGFLATLVGSDDGAFVIPEGGANEAGILGCSDICQYIPPGCFDQLVLACGTGTTMAGLLRQAREPVIGIQVLKGQAYLQAEVAGLLHKHGIEPVVNWHVEDGYHRGGYCRVDDALLEFCRDIETSSGVPLEPVYSGKLLMALCDMAAAGRFEPGSRLCVIHGGGLQGNRGFRIAG